MGGRGKRERTHEGNTLPEQQEPFQEWRQDWGSTAHGLGRVSLTTAAAGRGEVRA